MCVACLCDVFAYACVYVCILVCGMCDVCVGVVHVVCTCGAGVLLLPISGEGTGLLFPHMPGTCTGMDSKLGIWQTQGCLAGFIREPGAEAEFARALQAPCTPDLMCFSWDSLLLP